MGLTKGREYVPLLMLFVFSLPFKTSFSNISILLFAIYFIIAIARKRQDHSFDRKSFFAIKYLPALYGVFIITLIYSADLSSGLDYLGAHSFLLVIPLLFCFLRFTHREKSLIVTAFVSANLAAIFFNLIRALARSVQLSDGSFLFDASVAGGQPFWYSIVQGGNYFFYDEFSYFLHPTYWAIYLLFSTFAILSSLSEANSKKNVIFGP